MKIFDFFRDCFGRNRKGEGHFDTFFKIILWLIVFAVLIVALYFLLKRLTG
ncbi:hypothetical protein J4217_02720 [Candidatus Pacearchaeota archaeon]|nr:hypothetical protein [Candidatus Pacearchaeota archaeon]